MIDFIFKSFNEMTAEDYRKIGFKSGLEIHQQLLTEKKLFCHCPAGHYSDKYDAEILRHMRPTLSELGEYDGTALMEFKTKKNIIYRINRETVCTYEMDDTPPFIINEEALDIAIELGLMMNCTIVDELHIARKQYLDGSIPTGFQRTAIHALDGEIPYRDRKVEIVQMSIEEDSCREVTDVGHERVYLTDRLGMPLIETVTAPDMKTPNEVAEVADILSRIVRSSGKVRRGMGAAREDVNVSVEGGTRVEIKGVPKIPAIPLLTYNEGMRQWNLLRLKEELAKRGITEESFEATVRDISELLKNPHFTPIKKAVERKQAIKCVLLKGYNRLLNWQTQTNTYFSKEISDRVRVIACLSEIPNIIHSDSRGDNLTSSEWQEIIKYVGANENDTIVVVWGDEPDTATAANEIIIRAREATMGVPSETRQALSDGTNGFERILPGADRMYPDTDLPPEMIKEERVMRIKSSIGKPYWKREKWYREIGVPEDIIPDLAISKYAELFLEFVSRYQIDHVFSAVVLINYPKCLKKKGYNISLLNENIFRKLMGLYASGSIVREGVLMAIIFYLEKGWLNDEDILKPADEEEIEKTMDELIVKAGGMKLHKPGNITKVIMGLVMNELRGRVCGKMIAEKLVVTNEEEK